MNKKYFFCYNARLSKFLNSKGLQYITKAMHPASQQIFTLYEKNDNLLDVIAEYKKIYSHG